MLCLDGDQRRPSPRDFDRDRGPPRQYDRDRPPPPRGQDGFDRMSPRDYPPRGDYDRDRPSRDDRFGDRSGPPPSRSDATENWRERSFAPPPGD